MTHCHAEVYDGRTGRYRQCRNRALYGSYCGVHGGRSRTVRVSRARYYVRPGRTIVRKQGEYKVNPRNPIRSNRVLGNYRKNLRSYLLDKSKDGSSGRKYYAVV